MPGVKMFEAAVRISLMRTIVEVVRQIDELPEDAQIALLEAILGHAEAVRESRGDPAGVDAAVTKPAHWAADMDLLADDRSFGEILAERFQHGVDELQAANAIPGYVQRIADKFVGTFQMRRMREYQQRPVPPSFEGWVVESRAELLRRSQRGWVSQLIR